MAEQYLRQRGIRALGLVGAIFLLSAFPLAAAGAEPPGAAETGPCGAVCRQLASYTAAIDGEYLTVTNASETINGDVSSPTALLANPGPDGISLSEAVTAAEATSEYDVIQFDPSMKGAVIDSHVGLPTISHGNMLIDGDVDNDAVPDITLDGTNSARDSAFPIFGGSRVAIKGFVIRNFSKDGVSISPDKAGGAATVENIIIYQNDITSTLDAIEITIYMQDYAAVRNVEIVENNLHDSSAGVSVIAGMGDGATYNEISDISIRSNIIYNPGHHNGVFLSPAAWIGLSHNTLRNIEVRDNHITGHLEPSILVDASNQVNCNDNFTDGIVIADNYIEAPDVTIEIVGESGMYSTRNTISNMAITGNRLIGGGLQISGSTGYSAHDNTIAHVQIERNEISSGTANGIYLIAGSGGAYRNSFSDVTLRSNLVYDCADAGILLHGTTSSSPNNTISDVAISNQTLVNNGNSWAGGLNINSKDSSNTITGVTVTNTILWGNEGGDAIRGEVAPDSVTYSLLGDARYLGSDDNLYQDPLFVDAAAGDYRLQSTSIGVDTGDPSGGASFGAQDLGGNVRVWDGNADNNAVVDRGAWEYGSIATQEMDVQGNGISISDGDVVPVLWDATDFGAATEQGTPVQHIFTVANSGATALSLIGAPTVAISGEHAADFSVVAQPASTVPAGGTVTFAIDFVPGASGLREATVQIASDDNDENPYTFTIWGTGTAAATPPTEYYLYIPLVIR
jgi:hypothetical protein